MATSSTTRTAASRRSSTPNKTVDALARLRRASRQRADAERRWRNAIQAARDDGATLRSIAAAADVSHVRIIQILREDAPAAARK
jgi:hypothetical protein